MIKTIQYLAEADTSRVLVALDLKSGLIEQTGADLAAVFSMSTGCTTILPTPKSVPTAGFSAAVDPVLRSVLADICTHYDSGAELFAHLDDWYLWIKPQYLL